MSNNPAITTILILFANPASTPRLRLDEEARKIDEVFRRSNNRERFILEIKCAVRAGFVPSNFRLSVLKLFM